MKQAVIIETPFRGNIELNTCYARACMLDSLRRNEIPFLSHLLYTQVLDDSNPDQRKLGIEAGLEFGLRCDKTVVYTDLGISDGMELGILAAKEAFRKVEMRELPNFKVFDELRNNIETFFSEFCRVSGFSEKKMQSNSRERNLVYARHSFCFLSHQIFKNATFTQIGKFINRDHSTVTFYIKEVILVAEKNQAYIGIKSKMML